MSLASPSGLVRLALRGPVLLYRWRLGWLLGHRVLLLCHIGRRTGRVHATALEVVGYDRLTEECTVIAAWGDRSDWLRNIRAAPAVEVHVAGRRFVPSQRFLALRRRKPY